MKDLINNEVIVGDRVAFSDGKYAHLRIGTIIKINPKSVTVETTKHYGLKGTETTSKTPNQFIKINEENDDKKN